MKFSQQRINQVSNHLTLPMAKSRITTHVLDTAHGVAAQNVLVHLHYYEQDEWKLLGSDGYLSEHRQPYLALRLLKLMLMNPVFQNTTLTINDHHVILLIYSKCHQLESIKDHIQLMVSLNMKPDVKTFNILLFNLLKQKNLDEFNYVWEQFNQIWPGLIFLNAEIWCFAIELNGKLNRLDEAIELYQKLDAHYKLNRLPFPVIVKEAMIKAYGHNNRPQEAIQVFESIPFSVTDLHLPHSGNDLSIKSIGGFETIDAIIESCLASDSPFLAIDYWNFGMTLCSELDQLSGLGKRDVSYSIPWLEKKDQRYYQLKKFTYLLPQTYARMMSYYYNIRDYKQVIHLFNDHFHTMQTTRTAFEILCWTYLAQGDTLMANKSNFEMIQLYYPPSKILQTEITKMRKQFRTNKGLKNHQGKSMRLQGVLDIVKDQQLDLKTLKNVDIL
ncbi:hypothetical protein HDV02_002629 [Globomyces sp. JEL0801]|nr:hypothetical protein HDV02_002629 [Globomyces sp. JEL0801]